MGRRSRDLAWFPLFVDAWLGGTMSMPQSDLGSYIQALIAQWKSGEIQAIKDTQKSIKNACKGKMSSDVRNKFVSVTIDGQLYLRNLVLAEVYAEQKAKRERAGNGGRKGHKRATKNITRNVFSDTEERGQKHDTPSTESHVHAAPPSTEELVASRGKAPRSARSLPDEAWLVELQAKQCYQHLNVQFVYGKMVEWCAVKGKQPTRARLIGWLNREDLPMTASPPNGGANGRETAAERSARNIRESLEWVEQEFGQSGKDHQSDSPQNPIGLLSAGTHEA